MAIPGTKMKQYSFNDCSPGTVFNTTQGLISSCSRHMVNADRKVKTMCKFREG